MNFWPFEAKGGIVCRKYFESFIRFGGTKTFVLSFASRPVLELKQDDPSQEGAVSQWLDGVWNQTFRATAQAILKTQPFEFSSAGLSDLDIESVRADALQTVQAVIEAENLDIASADGEQRALAVLLGFLNQGPANGNADRILCLVNTTGYARP